MNFKTRLVSVVTAVTLLAGLLAGCGAQTAKTAQTVKQAAPAKAPVQLVLDQPVFGPIPADWLAVENAVSKITMQKIGCTVKVNLIPMASYSKQVNLILSGGQPVDVLYIGTFPTNMFMAACNEQALTPLNTLLDKYGQGIKQAIDPAFLRCAAINGKQYAIPLDECWGSQSGFTMSKDMVAKYHIDLSAVKSPQDMTAVWAKIKAEDPKAYPLAAMSQWTVMQYLRWYDTLGDSIGVLPNWDNGLKLVNIYATPKYAQMCGLMHSWYVKGYIEPDAPTSSSNPVMLIKTGRAFAMPGGSSPGWVTNLKRSFGVDLTTVNFPPPHVTSSDVTRDMYCIPRSSKHPDKAMQLLNLLYTDQNIVRLFDNGIPGKDYVKASGNIINYPPNVSPAQHYTGAGGAGGIGDLYLSYVYPPDPSDLYQQMQKWTNNAVKSKALGFQFNPAPVKTQYAAVQSVIAQYVLDLEDGVDNPKTTLPVFLKKLKTAGIDQVIAAKQQQLNQWAQANNVQG